MTAVVPRWEWRAFGEVDSALTTQDPTEVVESDEVYLLSAVGTHVVKVRDNLLDIKHLRQVADDGLELWTPVLKAAFPLSEADVTTVAHALGLEALASTGTSYSLDALLDGVVAPHPDLRAVEVSKTRQRYAIGGCLAEVTDVRTPTASTQTIAVESEDATRVLETVRGLGLATRPNVNFLRGLKALVGFAVDRVAVVDVGTNSVKFHISERAAGGGWTTLVDRAEVTRLGEGLRETGRLKAEPMARTMDAITGMAGEAARRRVAVIAAVGTAGLRMAPNGAEFVDEVLQRCGVRIEIISGEDEARLAYRAAIAGLGSEGSRVVFDTGGGSSQFTFGEGDRVDERFSVEVGAARFTEQFGLDGVVSDDVLAEARAAIADGFGRLDGRTTPETLIGMGGAVTNLAAVKHGLGRYDAEVVHGTVLDRAEIDRQIAVYRARAAEERREVVGLQPARAEVILAGACIVRTILDKLGSDSLRVSDRGLRHGVLAERFG